MFCGQSRCLDVEKEKLIRRANAGEWVRFRQLQTFFYGNHSRFLLVVFLLLYDKKGRVYKGNLNGENICSINFLALAQAVWYDRLR